MRIVLIFILSFTVFTTSAQIASGNNSPNFQRIFQFGDTTAIITNIFATDSMYYFYGTSGRGLQRCDLIFGKLNLDGSINSFKIDTTVNEFNQAYASLTQLDTNFRGNFVVSYTNILYNLSIYEPNITEISNDGIIVENFNIDLSQNDTLKLFDLGRVVQSYIDSTYVITAPYNIYHSGSFNFMEAGTILAKVNQLGDTIWTKRFTSFNTVRWSIVDLRLMSNGNIFLALSKDVFYTNNPNNDWDQLSLIVLDGNGNLLESHIVNDNEVNANGFCMLQLDDGSVIIPNYTSRIVTLPSGVQEREYNSTISRIKNYQKIWSDTLNDEFFANSTVAGTPFHLVLVNDSVFAGAYTHTYDTLYDSTLWYTTRSFESVRIFCKSIEGESIWNRDYIYWQLNDSIKEPEYILSDFDKTFDSGFIMCGNASNWDSLSANAPAQYGYVLKTNCLGFMGSPEAAFSYQTSDSLFVQFHNQSIQSGSYMWCFGDGDSLSTNEYVKNVTHTYQSSGSYEVVLVAYGCNGDADTLITSIYVPDIPVDTIIYVGDGTLLSVFPNPVNSGESLAIYVGDLNGETASLDIVDYSGKVVFSSYVVQSNTSYIIPVRFAAGMYMARLKNEKKTLEIERIMIYE